MQKNRRIILTVLLLVAVILLSAVLSACDYSELKKKVSELENKLSGYEGSSEEKTITLTVGESVFEFTTRVNNLHDALIEMKEKEIISAYVFDGSGFGVYVTEIGGLKADAAEFSYIAVFHDIDDAALKDFYNPDPLDQGGKTYFYSNVGVALLPVVDGASYLLALRFFA